MDSTEIDKNEDEVDEETFSDENSYNSENYELPRIVDNDFSIVEKQSAFFEQLPGQNKPVRCLSASELKNVMD